jgi:hypothetical protein
VITPLDRRRRRRIVAAVSLLALVLTATVVGSKPSPAGAVAGADVVAFGSAVEQDAVEDRPSSPVVGVAPTPSGAGYWLATADGGVVAFGDATSHGSAAGQGLSGPIVGMAPTPSGEGYWLVAADGGVFAFGDAPFEGSAAGRTTDAPVVGMAPTPSGEGYWVVARDGSISSFGDAPFRGVPGVARGPFGAPWPRAPGCATPRWWQPTAVHCQPLDQDVVGMAATPSGDGYWLVGSGGRVLPFGDARAAGSMRNRPLNRPIVGMAATPSGEGYWLAGSDGGIFSFGDATYRGAADGLGARSVVGIAAAPDGDGYWLGLTSPLELPGGGRTLFPDRRVVAYYGGPQSPRLGILGESSPEEAARRLVEQAEAYAGHGRPVLPAFELITVMATSAPQADGTYSSALTGDDVERYLDVARDNGMLLILDIQPGRSSFLTEARRFERFLRQPDVGLALDPEWSVQAPATPGGGTIGSIDAATINEVSEWLAGLVAEEGLPEKLFVIHQFTAAMVRDRDQVLERDGLATTFHIDGFGGRFAKRSKYEALRVEPPFANGFKLFYRQDTNLFSPAEVMSELVPAPDLVTYQ